MQIDMKLNEKDQEDLARRIADRRRALSLGISEIGRLARVDPSQVSRICAGEFKTLSSNVVQICRVLGIAVEVVETPKSAGDAAWSKLEAAVRAAWDQTPSGADKLVDVMNAVAAIQRN